MNIREQVDYVVTLSGLERTLALNQILEDIIDEDVKQKILRVKERIDMAAIEIDGYTSSEILHYQDRFAKDFHFILHLEKFTIFIQDKIRDLHFYCRALETDLRTKQYEFIEDREKDKAEYIEEERYKTYLEHLLGGFEAPPSEVQVRQSSNSDRKYRAKHYVLAYIFDSNAKGESLPIGSKITLEQIGEERMGEGKGNTFYKNFNRIVQKDLDIEKNLIEVCGENWRNIIIELSTDPDILEKFLKCKQL